MGYNYPFRQEQFYLIRAGEGMGYLCPMTMSFKEALKHAMAVRGLSMRQVAVGADVSYDILKNASQGRSERPNANAAIKVAAFFDASLEDFYRGDVHPLGAKPAPNLDALMRAVADLPAGDVDRVRLFAEALRASASQQDE